MTDHFRPKPKPYYPNCRLQPDSNDEFPLRLDAEIEPIPCGFIDSAPPASTDEQRAIVRFNSTAYDELLSEAVIGFLRIRMHGNLFSGSSYHSRNDRFLDIIRIVGAAGMQRFPMLDMTRDQYVPGRTLAQTGPGAAICQEGYPELVVVEEQAAGEVGAERELCDKFVFLPHYGRLTRIVGIVIVGNQFKIGFIHRDPKRFEALMNLSTDYTGNGYTLVRAAVNIGIWFRATMFRNALHCLPFEFGIPSWTAHSHLTIFRHQFRKLLYPHEDIDLGALSEFYKSIRAQPI